MTAMRVWTKNINQKVSGGVYEYDDNSIPVRRGERT